VLTTPQYRLPASSNVIMLPYSIGTVAPDAIPPASRGHLVVLVGGTSTTHTLGSRDAERLVSVARELAEKHDLGITVVTSRRTPGAVTEALARHGDDRLCLVPWRRPNLLGSEPSYASLVARAAMFVATSDSASMLADAYDTGRPVYVFPARERWLYRLQAGAVRGLRSLLPARAAGLVRRLQRAATTSGLSTPTRSMSAQVAALQRAPEWLRHPAMPCLQRGEEAGARQRAADALRALLARHRKALSGRA
jgi:hypothetical protein